MALLYLLQSGGLLDMLGTNALGQNLKQGLGTDMATYGQPAAVPMPGAPLQLTAVVDRTFFYVCLG